MLDDTGRIGGVINVIDALVILLVTAVIVAGLALFEAGTLAIAVTLGLAGLVAFAFAWTEDPKEIVYTTLDLGTQPPVVAQQVINDELDVSVVDAYVTPANDGVRTIVRTRVDSWSYQDAAQYKGQSIVPGADVGLQIGDQGIGATVVDVSDDPDLNRSTRKLLVTAEVAADVALEIESGDAYIVAGRSVATVKRVNRYGTTDADRVEVAVGLTVDALNENDRHTFAGKSLRIGESIHFRTEQYAFTGTIARVDTLEERGEPVTQTVRADCTDVPIGWREALKPGLKETFDGEMNARILSVETPDDMTANTNLCADGGNDLILEVELAARATESGLQFKRRPLEIGSTITLSLETITISPTIVSLE
ncbi:hypothetical protein ACFQO4_05325 [Saliphagus sp. GCM10025334]